MFDKTDIYTNVLVNVCRATLGICHAVSQRVPSLVKPTYAKRHGILYVLYEVKKPTASKTLHNQHHAAFLST
jgi:hypothetical protein